MELRDVSVDGSHCLEEQVGDPATVRALRVHRAMGQGIYAIPESLARMRRLERLSLHQVWGEALELPACLAELPALRELVVDAPAWTRPPAVVSRLHGLRALEIRRGALRQVDAISRLDGLTTLELSGPLDAPDALAGLARLPRIERLTLTGARAIDCQQLPIHAGLERLELAAGELHGWGALTRGSGLVRAGLSALPRRPVDAVWPRLRELDLCGPEGRADGLRGLASASWPLSPRQLPSLERLSIASCERVELAPLRGFTGLRHLELIDVASLRSADALAELPRLRHLGIRGEHHGALDLDLSGCAELRSLELPASAHRAFEGLLAQAPTLKRLYVSLYGLSEEDEEDLIQRAARAGVALNYYREPTPWSD